MKVAAVKKEEGGLEESQAAQLFDTIEKFAGYGFNKAHSVEYTILSYWSMWLKVHYPAEFYAAALTILNEDHRQALVKDAEKAGIKVYPPMVNASTDRFEVTEINNETVLVAPFNLMRGISEASAKKIVKARESLGGKFESIEQFELTVPGRACNKTVRENMKACGSFSDIDPDDKLPALHPDRLKAQKINLPQLIAATVAADRKIEMSGYVKRELKGLIDECMSCDKCSLAGSPHAKPRIGRNPKAMVILDKASFYECQAGKMLEGKPSLSIKSAMESAGLTVSDLYVTSLVRGMLGKGEQVSSEMIIGCSGHLDRELELVKPAVILVLGKQALQHLVPDAKGSFDELTGKDFYLPKIDATVIAGFNPGMIYFDPNKQDALDKLFKQVADII